MPPEVAKAAHYKLDQAAPVARIEDQAANDAVVIGVGTRFGRIASQMANFLDVYALGMGCAMLWPRLKALRARLWISSRRFSPRI